MHRPKHHVFGPAPSRRLGRSLGVDLVPHKACSYDCIYCQLGPTTDLRWRRGAFVSIDAVLGEIEAKLAVTAPPDYITLSGSGEPTLQVNLGALIQGIKRITDRPVAVLTNGSLFWRKEVRRELREADLIIPSLDAGDEATFRRVNRPHPRLAFMRVVEGLTAFRREYAGQIWLEVFLVADLTAVDEQIDKIGTLLGRIAPDRIQLNTVARPPSEAYVRPASTSALAHAAQRFGARAEIIAEGPAMNIGRAVPLPADEILALLQRRPCTLDDIAAGLGAHRLEVAKMIEQLVRERAVVVRPHGRRVYYQPASPHTVPDSSVGKSGEQRG